MKQLLLLPLFMLTCIIAFAQGSGAKNDTTKTLYEHNGVVLSRQQKEGVRDTSVVSYKRITYEQTRIELFGELAFDTLYTVQYAIVSEVTSMPKHSMALPFYTDDHYMYMIVSDRNYFTYEQARAMGEKVRDENDIFEVYIVKAALHPASSPDVARKRVYENGNVRIQYQFTDRYPENVLDGFIVEYYEGGFRQISERAYEDRAAAQNWLLQQGLDLKDFWVYPLPKKEIPFEDRPAIESPSPEIGEGTNNEIRNK